MSFGGSSTNDQCHFKTLCKWHKKWGEKARKCKKLCSRYVEHTKKAAVKSKQANKVEADPWTPTQELPKSCRSAALCSPLKPLVPGVGQRLDHGMLMTFRQRVTRLLMVGVGDPFLSSKP